MQYRQFVSELISYIFTKNITEVTTTNISELTAHLTVERFLMRCPKFFITFLNNCCVVDIKLNTDIFEEQIT